MRQVWDSSGGGCVRYSAAAGGEATMGHVVENDVIQAALLRQLRQPGVDTELLWPARPRPAYCTLFLRHAPMAVQLLVAVSTTLCRMSTSVQHPYTGSGGVCHMPVSHAAHSLTSTRSGWRAGAADGAEPAAAALGAAARWAPGAAGSPLAWGTLSPRPCRRGGKHCVGCMRRKDSIVSAGIRL